MLADQERDAFTIEPDHISRRCQVPDPYDFQFCFLSSIARVYVHDW